jgi:hypothetical protein
MTRWEFTPYNIVEWNNSSERILFVAAEPNGEQPNGGNYDMGEWFRTAKQDNNFHNNERFFRRSEIILTGILNGENIDDVFGCFRFMDLKATSGCAKSDLSEIENYVINNLNEVIKYFNSTDKKFGLSPHIIVLLGNAAQSIFKRLLRPRLMNNSSLQWVGMPHPSHTVDYEALAKASAEIRKHLNPITNRTTNKWIYQKGNLNNWKSIP